ncbi:NAD(P)/FAD-dependent oxidoreductase [Roseibium sp. Sym1]|uniref:NAD(P)/FAD-dependent oxidoreductase n=1 Tax=Roseibium sp. Sym1 TaxID=3016006 RepID=UPI0022B3B35F|nr:TIGR03862 family flavoprotein [Roseibium sp. Sym1]
MRDVLIIGAGPTGLFAADRLSANGVSVTIADRMPSPARKFLMAGRGGLNLTHSEDPDRFVTRYREAAPFVAPLIRAFPPQALRDWCHGLGQETFVGSSGRVFPKAMKASPLLRAWLHRLDRNGVRLLTRHAWTGFGRDGTVELENEAGEILPFPARACLLALGGASWPKLGSSAAWVPLLEARGIRINRFQPSNCGFRIAWSDHLKNRFAGSPLKRIALSHKGTCKAGEAVLSGKGLEGGAVYALSAELRETLNQEGSATLEIDLRPGMSAEDLARKLSKPRGKQSAATFLKKALRLKPEELALVREAGDLPSAPTDLAQRIKAVSVTCQAAYPIDRAISSAGGVALEELDEALMLKKCPGVFAAGEMLDWEAPTGGYLLQACFAMGARAADGIEAYLKTTGEN